MRILPSGDTALLAELTNVEQALTLYQLWRHNPPCEVLDVVPAARTVLFRVDPSRTGLAELTQAIASSSSNALDAKITNHIGNDLAVRVPVRYDGEDLNAVADLLRCTPRAVIELHTSVEWRVAFCGFAPGFAYLDSPHAWDIPRHATPRQRIPAGSVALAGRYCGIYPRSSPGGWQLIGRTDIPLFDPQAEPPTLLTPGTRVRFTASPT